MVLRILFKNLIENSQKLVEIRNVKCLEKVSDEIQFVLKVSIGLLFDLVDDNIFDLLVENNVIVEMQMENNFKRLISDAHKEQIVNPLFADVDFLCLI